MKWLETFTRIIKGSEPKELTEKQKQKQQQKLEKQQEKVRQAELKRQELERRAELKRQEEERKRQELERKRQERAEQERLKQQKMAEFEQQHYSELECIRNTYNNICMRSRHIKFPKVEFTYSCPFNMIPQAIHDWNRNTEMLEQEYYNYTNTLQKHMNIMRNALNKNYYSENSLHEALGVVDEARDLTTKIESVHKRYMTEVEIMKKSPSIIDYKIR